VAVLKSPDFADWQSRNGNCRTAWTPARTPAWTDTPTGPAGPPSRRDPRAEARHPFSRQPDARTIAAAPITLAMFESEANTLAAVLAV
jgi:hypothetical protein